MHLVWLLPPVRGDTWLIHEAIVVKVFEQTVVRLFAEGTFDAVKLGSHHKVMLQSHICFGPAAGHICLREW